MNPDAHWNNVVYQGCKNKVINRDDTARFRLDNNSYIKTD